LKFRKKHKSSIDLQNSNFLLIFFTDLKFLQKRFLNLKKNINLLLIYFLNFFQAAQGAHHQQEGFGEEDRAEGPHRRSLQGRPDSRCLERQQGGLHGIQQV
jgi:hypothetical protein